MIHLAEWLPDLEECETLSPKLSWSHFFELLAVPDQRKRGFYATFAAHERWSMRTLRERIGYRRGGGAAREAADRAIRARVESMEHRGNDPLCRLAARFREMLDTVEQIDVGQHVSPLDILTR